MPVTYYRTRYITPQEHEEAKQEAELNARIRRIYKELPCSYHWGSYHRRVNRITAVILSYLVGLMVCMWFTGAMPTASGFKLVLEASFWAALAQGILWSCIIVVANAAYGAAYVGMKTFDWLMGWDWDWDRDWD